jgi:hypothetical protein
MAGNNDGKLTYSHGSRDTNFDGTSQQHVGIGGTAQTARMETTGKREHYPLGGGAISRELSTSHLPSVEAFRGLR